MQEGSISKNDFLALAGILVVALILRVIGINAPLWYDEIVTVSSYVSLPWGEMLQNYSMNNHIFFSLQVKAAALIFGEANWTYRLPAVLFGLGTVAAAWLLARSVAGRTVAHVSALLIAISYHQIWFSQNARGYTELAFWSLLAMVFFLRGIQTPSRGLWIAYGLTLAAAVFTHLTGALFFVAQGFVWLVLLVNRAVHGGQERDLILFPLIGAGIGLALLLAVYAQALPTVLSTVGSASKTSAVDVMKEYQNPLWTIAEGVHTAVGSSGTTSLLIAVAVLVMIVLGALSAHARAPWFAPIVIVHILLTFVLLKALGMRIWPRFFFIDIAFIMILVVIGVSVLSRWLGLIARRPDWSHPLFLLGAFLMVVTSVVLLPRNYSAPKQNLSGAFALAEEMRGANDRVFSVGHSGPIFEKYFKADWGSITTPDGYSAALSEPGPLLLIVAFPARSFRVIPALGDDLGDTFRLVRHFPGTLGDGDILVIRRD